MWLVYSYFTYYSYPPSSLPQCVPAAKPKSGIWKHSPHVVVIPCMPKSLDNLLSASFVALALLLDEPKPTARNISVKRPGREAQK